MKVNTKKIVTEMERIGWSYKRLALEMGMRDRRGAWYLVHNAKQMSSIDRIAEALGLEGKDLVK